MLPRLAPLTSRERGATGAIAIVGLFASFWRLGTSQVLPDEVVYLRAGASLVAGTGDPNLEHPPLAKWLYGVAGEITGSQVWGGRAVAAAASVAIGVLLFHLLRRMVGTRGGLLAAGLWAALPHSGGAAGTLAQAGRLDRFAMLDPVMAALALGAVVAGWSWLERPRWQGAALAGLLGGLAAGAKPTGVLVLPAIAVVVLWTRRREFPRPVTGVAIAVLASLVGLALAYAPLGAGALDGLRHLIEFQSRHAAEGHGVTVAGTTTTFPPWWSHLWFHLRDDGPALSVILLGAPFAALAAVRAVPSTDTARRGVAYLVTVFGVLFVTLAASPVKLPFYRYAWLPVLTALLAIALDAGLRASATVLRPEPGADARKPGRGAGGWPVAGVAGIAVVGAVLVGTSAQHLWGVATLRPDGYQLVVAEVVDTSGFVVEGIEPMLLRGRPAVLDFTVAAHLMGFPLVIQRATELADATSVLLDPEITSRFPHEADAVLGDPGWDCQPYETLTLCLRSRR